MAQPPKPPVRVIMPPNGPPAVRPIFGPPIGLTPNYVPPEEESDDGDAA